MEIDISYDFRTDSFGRDPDTHSPTLRRYHKILWSRTLPNGQLFDLSDATPGVYLHHRSRLGEFFLSSDSVIPTYAEWQSLKPVTEKFPQSEIEVFRAAAYTIGGMMVFPANQIGGKQTINGARGFTRAISDRFDLTLECIRRYYLGLESPLVSALSRYSDFFELFNDFNGYVNFFLLDDLVNSDEEVKFFMPFDDFRPPSVPQDINSYMEYRRRSVDFIDARNERIGFLEV